jgi:hypothetical protein
MLASKAAVERVRFSRLMRTQSDIIIRNPPDCQSKKVVYPGAQDRRRP